MKCYVSSFIVTGGVRFPLDMLRYDRCFPATGDDAAALSDGVDREVMAKDRRPVRLLHVGNYLRWEPTIERWRSFGWSVERDSLKTESMAL